LAQRAITFPVAASKAANTVVVPWLHILIEKNQDSD